MLKLTYKNKCLFLKFKIGKRSRHHKKYFLVKASPRLSIIRSRRYFHMRYKKNSISYINLLCSFLTVIIIWAACRGIRKLEIYVLLVLAAVAILRFAVLAKFKNDILENDTPVLFKISNQFLGAITVMMSLCLMYLK